MPKKIIKKPVKNPAKKTDRRPINQQPVVKLKRVKNPRESGFNELIDAWLATTFENKKVDNDEVFHRIGTLFLGTCERLNISYDHACRILENFAEMYRNSLGIENACPKCQAEQTQVEEKNRLLN